MSVLDSEYLVVSGFDLGSADPADRRTGGGTKDGKEADSTGTGTGGAGAGRKKKFPWSRLVESVALGLGSFLGYTDAADTDEAAAAAAAERKQGRGLVVFIALGAALVGVLIWAATRKN